MRTPSSIAAVLSVTFALLACNGDGDSPAPMTDDGWDGAPEETTRPTDARGQDIEVNLIDREGDPVGTARLSDEGEEGVRISLDLRNLPPGERAIHFHETASCETPDFESAGGHFNPDDRAHGFEAPDGYHAGDIPNIRIQDDGTARTDVVAPRARMNDSEFSILRNDGTALVIHEGPDDYETDPSGDSGDRIACGEIRPGG